MLPTILNKQNQDCNVGVLFTKKIATKSTFLLKLDNQIKLTLKKLKHCQIATCDKLVGAVHVDAEIIGDEGLDFLVFIQQQHCTEVPDPLVSELRAGNQLRALKLTKVSRVAKHVNVKKLGNISASPHGVLVTKSISDVGTFLKIINIYIQNSLLYNKKQCRSLKFGISRTIQLFLVFGVFHHVIFNV